MSRIMSTPISSCDTHDIWTWYRSGTTWDMRWRTILTFTMIQIYHLISISIMVFNGIWVYHGISWCIMLYHVVSCDISVWGSPTSAWEVLWCIETFLTMWREGGSLRLLHRPSCQPPCTGSGVFLSPFCLSTISPPSSSSGLGSWAVHCKRKAASARPGSLPWPSSAWLQGCERKCQSCGCPCTHIRGRMDSPCRRSLRIPPQAGSSSRRQQLRRCQPACQSPFQHPWAPPRWCTTCICDITWYRYDIVNKLMISHDIGWYRMIYSLLDEPWRNLLVGLEPFTGQHIRGWGVFIRVDALVSIECNHLSSPVLGLRNPLNR